MTKLFEGKTVLVTGASRGLGSVIAERFALNGADVAISYAHSADRATEVVERLRAAGAKAIAIESDQSDPATAKPLIDQVIGAFGKLDILVNNAGVTAQGLKVDDPQLDWEEYDRQWHVNVLGGIANTRAAALKLSDGGRIVFIGSMLGSYMPFPAVADYGATKWALAGYAKGVARDLGRRNITVNVVQPGIMPTDMGDAVQSKLPDRDSILDMQPIHRIATLEEVAALVCFLAGPEAGYITGEQINIAGGLGI